MQVSYLSRTCNKNTLSVVLSRNLFDTTTTTRTTAAAAEKKSLVNFIYAE